MRKVMLVVLVSMFILSACQSSALSLKKVKDAPDKLADYIDPTAELQMVHDGKKGAYIVFTTSGKVEVDVKSNKNVIRIYLNKPEEKDDILAQHIYYLTKGEGHDTIEVLLNDEETHFDLVTSM